MMTFSIGGKNRQIAKKYHQKQSFLSGRSRLKNIDSEPVNENGEKIVSDFVMCVCGFFNTQYSTVMIWSIFPCL